MPGIAGTFSAPGLSPSFTPPQINQPFYIIIGGSATGYNLNMAQSIAGAPFALMLDFNGLPVQYFNPGGVQIAVPYTAPGAQPPSYQLVCKVIGAGQVNWQFSQ